MSHMTIRNDITGFSLVELMIVIVIIGTLAAIAVPIYSNNATKARMSEADVNLGSIRSDLRVYQSAHDEYPTVNPAGYVIGATWNDIRTGEMTGKYFTDSSYTYHCTDGYAFTISCAPGSELLSPRTLNQSGVLAGGL
ncbi:MAG: prepilin-type N-terminal cleavage/methylation domain-containing protein [Candidatus Marinimicrobia bacterium]|nr:prepilin-type N-terminal cleavage/methylation domain-containing protein [Candidatus Neomarinimicrobiota bacterium]